MTTVPPLRREIIVDADPDLAFAVFTERIGEWWPLHAFSVHGAGATVAFVDRGLGSAIVESSPGAADAVWGTVTRWDPPDSVAFTWHPGKEAEAASQVSVAFEPADGKTLVRLEHTGWEIFAEPAAAREEYGHGWPAVLDGFAALVAAG
jgi:hypothetical protein